MTRKTTETKNDKQNKIPRNILILLALLSSAALCLSVFALAGVLSMPAANMRDVQYVMYLGTNVPTDPAQADDGPTAAEELARLEKVLTRHFSGFTVQEAYGGWTDDDGVFGHEFTFVIYLSDTTKSRVTAAADELLREFGQYSILIQSNITKTEFHTGK